MAHQHRRQQGVAVAAVPADDHQRPGGQRLGAVDVEAQTERPAGGGEHLRRPPPLDPAVHDHRPFTAETSPEPEQHPQHAGGAHGEQVERQELHQERPDAQRRRQQGQRDAALDLRPVELAGVRDGGHGLVLADHARDPPQAVDHLPGLGIPGEITLEKQEAQLDAHQREPASPDAGQKDH